MKKIVKFYYFSKVDLIVICTDSLIKTCSTIESEWKGEVGLKHIWNAYLYLTIKEWENQTLVATWIIFNEMPQGTTFNCYL